MKINFAYLLTFSLLIFILSCSEEDPVEVVEPIVQPEEESMYFPPTDNPTAWERADITTLGWKQDLLQDVINYVQEKNSTSFIILHKGKIVAEEYFRGTTIDSIHTIESASKSMTAFLFGILEDEYGLDINQTVSSFLGDGWSNAPIEKEQLITVKQLMTMTSGLDYENSYIADPDTEWYYSNEAYEVLLRLFEPITGKNYVDFSRERLFSKIGMNSVVWRNHMVECTARDMARFGLLVLAEGKWNDEQVMKDSVYFHEMLTTSQDLQPPYGYLWWLNGKDFYVEEDSVYQGPLFSLMPSDAVIAAGRHEQRIEVIPSLDIVVVRQGDATFTPERGDESFGNGVWQRLMRAISNE
jgi:CubicO group peptidase (beta-lactamase class C family)